MPGRSVPFVGALWTMFKDVYKVSGVNYGSVLPYLFRCHNRTIKACGFVQRNQSFLLSRRGGLQKSLLFFNEHCSKPDSLFHMNVQATN